MAYLDSERKLAKLKVACTKVACLPKYARLAAVGISCIMMHDITCPCIIINNDQGVLVV
jgi:hypothetical protein